MKGHKADGHTSTLLHTETMGCSCLGSRTLLVALNLLLGLEGRGYHALSPSSPPSPRPRYFLSRRHRSVTRPPRRSCSPPASLRWARHRPCEQCLSRSATHCSADLTRHPGVEGDTGVECQ